MTSRISPVIPISRTFRVTFRVPPLDDVDNFAEEVHSVLEDEGFEVRSVEAQDSPQEPGDDAQ